MKLAGTVNVHGIEYFVYAVWTGKSEEYYLFSKTTNKSITSLTGRESLFDTDLTDYLVGAVKRSKATGKVKVYKQITAITQMMDAYHDVRMYAFKDAKVFKSQEGMEIQHASDGDIIYNFRKSGVQVSYLLVQYNGVLLELEEIHKTVKLPKISFVEAKQQEQRSITKATLETIHYEDLCSMLDMSWYKKDGVLKKRYRAVHSVQEFEDMFCQMMEDACKEPLLVALDTETTGLNIYSLSKDNPIRDHGVAISISWKDNEAYVIFNDMEYFGNVEASYCFRRLASIFTEENDDITVSWAGKTKCFPRSHFHLIGHNFPFDRRVSIMEEASLWFDDDTLNMAFNIDPKTVRGNNKLKNITRRLFGHETPELEDVLGRGNEDKFRWLADEEVACIYAGADADYTRLIYPVLRRILGEKMYFRQHSEDSRLLNILALSEYHGLRVEEEGAKKLAKQVYENLKILEEAAFRYVGAYMDFNQKVSVLKARYDSGFISEEMYRKELLNIEIDKDARYTFEFKGSDIRMVMYDILKYKVFAKTETGIPKTDKYVRKKLLAVKRKENSKARKLSQSILVFGADYAEYNRLLNGSEGDKKKAKKMELINKDVFNSKEYPMALIFQEYAVLYKEYTSYYKPILEGNMEGRLFHNYSLTRIETRRIMNPSQTMKKNLKEFILPYSDNYYTLDFDLSQIELRLMYSLSGSKLLIDKMKDPEKDAHTENAAMVNQKPAYQVTKKERKDAKSVSFGVPYGLGERSLCETMLGDATERNMLETRMTLLKWKKANAPIVQLLEDARAQALEPVSISTEKRDFIGAWRKDPDTGEFILDREGKRIPIPLGAVYNLMGFCRYFDLSGIDQSEAAKKRRKNGEFTAEEGVIRRAAGNYPIQSYAAEFFRNILYRFYDRCKKEGIADKIIWNMLIHDELLCSVHKSVNPILIMKIVKESCMISMPEHTNYYVGINMGDNWAETKDDAREAPVLFVNRMIKRWDSGEFRECKWFDHPWKFIKPLREQYISDRIYEELVKIQPGIDGEAVNVPLILDKFDNYTVRAYVYDYPQNSQVDGSLVDSAKENAEYISHLESWILQRFGEGKEMISMDGTVYKVYKGVMQEVVSIKEDDYSMVSDYEVYDFDEDGIIDSFFEDDATMAEDDGLQFDMSVDATSVADMTVTKKRYKNLKLLNNCLIINLDNMVQMECLKTKLIAGDGYRVMFKVAGFSTIAWKKVSTGTDLFSLDADVENLRQLPATACYYGRGVLFKETTPEKVKTIMLGVKKYRGHGYPVFIQYESGQVAAVGSVGPTADFNTFV